MKKFLLPLFLFSFSCNVGAQVWNGNQFKCTWDTTLATIAMVQSSPIIAVADGVWGSSSGLTTLITSAAGSLPLLVAGDYFEVRDHSTAGNNGRYQASGVPTVKSIPASKVVAPNPANAASEAVSVYLQSQCDQRIDGKRRYITDIAWASSTIGTATNNFLLSYGTGLDCVTTATGIFRDYNPATFKGRSYSFLVPIITPINTALCVTHPGGGTLLITVGGYAR